MAFVNTDGGLRLAALVPSKQSLSLIDPATGVSKDVALGAPYEHLSLVTGIVGGVAAGADVALLWSASSPYISFVALGSTAGKPYKSVERLQIEQPIARVIDVPAPNDRLKILAAADGRSFFVLDLIARTASPILSSTYGVDVTVSADGQRSWLLAPGGSDLAALSLDNLHPQNFTLASPLQQAFEVGRRGGGRALVAVHAARRSRPHRARRRAPFTRDCGAVPRPSPREPAMSAHTFLGAAALAAMTDRPPRRERRSGARPTRSTLASKDVATTPAKASFRRPEINLALGFRAMAMPSAGLDPYATNDASSSSRSPRDQRSCAAALSPSRRWPSGTSAPRSPPRAATPTSLTMHRLGVGLESRFQLASRFMIFAKLSPAAVHLRGSIERSWPRSALVSRSWSWALDTTAGAAVLFARSGPREAPTSRFWFTGELGYGFAGQSHMVYAPEANEDDPRKYGSIMLPALRPSGALMRLAMLVSF